MQLHRFVGIGNAVIRRNYENVCEKNESIGYNLHMVSV